MVASEAAARGLNACSGNAKLKAHGLADLDSQTLATLGASCRYYSAAATRLHARQKAVRAGTLDFGGLVCTFHDASYVPMGYKLSENVP